MATGDAATKPRSGALVESIRSSSWSSRLAVALIAALVVLLLIQAVREPAQFAAQLVIGITNGAIIALVALGYTLVYGIIELINFAHGDNFMIGSFVGLTVLSGTFLGLGFFGGIIENNAAQLIKDKVGAGMSNEEVAFIGPDGIFVDELISQAGDAAEGIYVTFGGLPQSELSEEGQQFVQNYEEQYDEPIQPYTAYAYEAANVMLDAIERASEEAGGGVPEREAVVQQIFATEDYKGALGTWSFDEDGDTTLTELSVQTVENGEFKLDRVLDVADL